MEILFRSFGAVSSWEINLNKPVVLCSLTVSPESSSTLLILEGNWSMKRKHGETEQHCWGKSPQEEMGGSHGPVGWALDQELHGLVSSSGATSMCYFWKVITSHRNFVSLSENCREWIKWSLRIFLAPDLVPFSLEASRVCCCFFLPVTYESLSFMLPWPFFAFLLRPPDIPQLPCFVLHHTRTQQPAGARDQSVFDKDKSVLRTGTDV